MTERNYTYKARALFLAALMVFSVFAGTVAFAGTAAANAEQTDSDVTLNSGSTYWDGQEAGIYIPDDVDGDTTSTTDYQVRSFDPDGNDGSGSIGGLEEEFSLDGDDRTAVIDTSGYDGEFVITPADDSSTAIVFVDGNADSTETSDGNLEDAAFEVTTQNLDVEIDEDSVNDEGENAVTEIDVDSNRANYQLNVSANGDLDAGELSDIFVNNDGDDADYQLIDENEGDDDEITIALAENSETAEGDEREINFTGIDEGEYGFNFSVPDSTAESSDTVEVTERDTDSSFSEGVTTDTAGDIAEFTVEMDDTDEVWVQFGDEDVGFIDILRLEDDDDDDEVTFQVNTRTLGTSADRDDVYNSEDDIVESEVHDDDTGATFWDEDTDEQLGGGEFVDYLDELNLIDADGDADEDDVDEQLTRPLQPADYELTAATDGQFIVNSDGETEADEELDSALFELTEPGIEGVTIHKASADNADEDDNVADLLNSTTAIEGGEEVAMDDRLVVQVEATGLYGAAAYEADSGFDALEDGTTLNQFNRILTDDNHGNNWAGEGINFEVEADDATGNQEATSLDLTNNNAGDGYVLYDEENGQFFVVVDTSADSNVFSDELDEGAEFSAEFEYETDSDNRYEFNSENPAPYQGDAGGDGDGDAAYPYFQADSTQTESTSFTVEERTVTFDNVNDGVLEIPVSDSAEVTGTTNVAPGSDAEVRISSTDADPSFRSTADAEISEDGTFSAEFDFSDQSAGDLAETTFRVAGSSVDTVDTELVESVSTETDAPDTETDAPDTETDAPDTETDAPDTETDAPDTDTATEEPTSTSTPGFGVVVALTALIAAALLAVRRND
ncbi:BGTF surface domain-containing protein [Halobellus rarus]|uniref:BGTF surface domain-containing protein n=1 Tax=Halobellus rarus TaxID=1126237 RepID=UPI002112B57E|nr:BGTF surface domain-containing protein [Halobellus rarus]